MNIFEGNSCCVISEKEKVDLEFLDTYTYLVQKEDDSLLKIWYKNLLTDTINMISIRSNDGQAPSCIEALSTLICKSGLMGLDYLDAFQYMGGELRVSSFKEYSIKHNDGRQIVANIETAKEFCRTAKSGVVLIDGWYTLFEAQEILDSLECDDIEIAFQVHVNESKHDGKLYIWVAN